MSQDLPSNDPWQALRPLTAARIGQPRSGASLGTPALLDFRLAHARARDAVSAALDTEPLQAAIGALGLTAVVGHSAAADRRQYLLRPDLGRALSEASAQALASHARGGDLAIVIADGLSAHAAQQHAVPVLTALLPRLQTGWRLAPVTLLQQGRVAAGDAVAAALQAACVLVLIGERPGLSAPDSLGAYLTWNPVPGRSSDADRNCISNIRPEGLPPARAAGKIAWLLGRMREMRGSGVRLKDEMQVGTPLPGSG